MCFSAALCCHEDAANVDINDAVHLFQVASSNVLGMAVPALFTRDRANKTVIFTGAGGEFIPAIEFFLPQETKPLHPIL
jgi:hypothetical protein